LSAHFITVDLNHGLFTIKPLDLNHGLNQWFKSSDLNQATLPATASMMK
jgi:hypothetical protein